MLDIGIARDFLSAITHVGMPPSTLKAPATELSTLSQRATITATTTTQLCCNSEVFDHGLSQQCTITEQTPMCRITQAKHVRTYNSQMEILQVGVATLMPDRQIER